MRVQSLDAWHVLHSAGCLAAASRCTHCPCALHSASRAPGDLCAGLVEPGKRTDTTFPFEDSFGAAGARAPGGAQGHFFSGGGKGVLEQWRRVNLLQHLFCGDAGVCGLGPATRLLRRMNSLLRFELVRRESHEENEENVRKCLVVQRKDGGGREVTNHDELLRALHLLPSSCAGRWQVGCLWHRSSISCVVE